MDALARLSTPQLVLLALALGVFVCGDLVLFLRHYRRAKGPLLGRLYPLFAERRPKGERGNLFLEIVLLYALTLSLIALAMYLEPKAPGPKARGPTISRSAGLSV